MNYICCRCPHVTRLISKNTLLNHLIFFTFETFMLARGFAFSNTPRLVGGMNNICMDWMMLRLVQTQMICSTFQARGLLVPNVIHSSYVTDASIGIAFCVLLFILPSRRPNYLCFRRRAGAYSSNMEKRTY